MDRVETEQMMKCEFDEINFGEVFEGNNDLYIKTYDMTRDELEYNAVNLENGEPVFFYDSDVVTKVDAKLIIFRR